MPRCQIFFERFGVNQALPVPRRPTDTLERLLYLSGRWSALNPLVDRFRGRICWLQYRLCAVLALDDNARAVAHNLFEDPDRVRDKVSEGNSTSVNRHDGGVQHDTFGMDMLDPQCSIRGDGHQR
jgi:hypothetical protein